jgi:uncharacterized membrane protein
MLYLALKSLHVVSVVLFLGNIITGVFWKVHADLSGDLRVREQAILGLIRSDRIFTVPGVLLITATGVALALMANFPLLRTFWIAGSLVLFGISGLAFAFKVGPLQKKLTSLTSAPPWAARSTPTISCCTITNAPASTCFSVSPTIRSAPAITCCNRRSPSGRPACSAAAICKARKANSTFCRKNTPISSSR